MADPNCAYIETTIELCLKKIDEAKTKDEAYAKVNELLTLVKTNKIEQFEKMLWECKR